MVAGKYTSSVVDRGHFIASGVQKILPAQLKFSHKISFANWILPEFLLSFAGR